MSSIITMRSERIYIYKYICLTAILLAHDHSAAPGLLVRKINKKLIKLISNLLKLISQKTTDKFKSTSPITLCNVRKQLKQIIFLRFTLRQIWETNFRQDE